MKKHELPQEIPLGHSNDLRGQKFSKLTPLYRCKSPTASNYKRTYWVCKCDCGEYCIKRSDHLTTGHIQSCGCINALNLTGQRFGKLIALEPIPGHRYNNGDIRKWKCQCDCGNICLSTTEELTSGKKTACSDCRRSRDLTGQRFGKLTALHRTERDKWGNWKWLCECDCGNSVEVILGSLISGNTKSCGCLISAGEAKIQHILEENNVSFKKQYTFENCINPKTGAKLKFDFYLPDYNCCIEYDGIQHFEKDKTWPNGCNLEETQYRDNLKNIWCKKNGVILKRIPYWEYDNLTYENIMDNTFIFVR